MDNSWVQAVATSGGGLLSSARNAHSLVPVAKDTNKWLLYGGWVPFTKTFNDSYLIELKT